ncbi:hypothetical protein ACVWXQ_005583 [Bradyrhizobium sp. S3.14.4]
MPDEQRQRAIARLNLIDELRGFAGEIGEAAAGRLHGQQ